MRILMLTHTYPPVLGGIERHVSNLSADLVRRGHSVAVVTLGDGQLPNYEIDQGVRIYRLRGTVHRLEQLLFTHPGRSYSPPFPDPEITWQLRTLIEREQPEVVHGHNWLVHAFLPLKRWSGAKLVVTLHDYGMVCSKWNLIRDGEPCSGPAPIACVRCAANHYGASKGIPTVMLGWVSSRWEWAEVDLFLPVSQAVAIGNQLAEHGATYQVIPNFLGDAVAAQPLDRAPLATLPSEPFILFVGAFARAKGVDIVLQAYTALRTRFAAPPLVLIGYETGDNPQSLANLPPGVTIVKNLPNALVLEAWQQSMFGVVPSIWPEPCPTVAMEAMRCGRPVIGSRIGGLPDLIEDLKTGLLVPPGDVQALAQAMAVLALSPALCEQMGAAGKRKVLAFQADTVIQTIEAAYARVLRYPHSPPKAHVEVEALM